MNHIRADSWQWTAHRQLCIATSLRQCCASQSTPFKKADKKAMGVLFDYLQVCLEQVVKDNELGALQQALEGAYVEPGPGGDPIRCAIA